jgi:aminoglycoside phosphotransferase (APT) family kinase protein
VSEPELDAGRLAAWMDRTGAFAGTGAPLTTRFLSGGTQNVIYELTRGDARCVLRMPPPGAPQDRDKGILREWRIIEALDGTDVPHTEAVAVCDDASVLGRPFYLMGFVDGWSPVDDHQVWPEPFRSDLDLRPGLSYQLAEGIALLSKVDWQGKGLQDLGRPDGFHQRQVERWIGFLERIKERDLPGLDVATEWLRAHGPLASSPVSCTVTTSSRTSCTATARPRSWPRWSTGRWVPSATPSWTWRGWCRRGPTTWTTPRPRR